MKAIEEVKKDSTQKVDFRLVRVPFFLEPDYIGKDPDFRESHEERMVRKFGSLEAFNRVKATHGLIPRGAEVGLDASVGFTQETLDKRIQSSTLASHRLILFITQHYGLEKAEALYDELNNAHFIRSGALADYKLLESCLKKVLRKEELQETKEFLYSNRGIEEVLAFYEQTQEAGLHSIPTLIIDGRVIVSGAARSDEVKYALEKVIAEGPTGSRAFHPPEL